MRRFALIIAGAMVFASSAVAQERDLGALTADTYVIEGSSAQIVRARDALQRMRPHVLTNANGRASLQVEVDQREIKILTNALEISGDTLIGQPFSSGPDAVFERAPPSLSSEDKARVDLLERQNGTAVEFWRPNAPNALRNALRDSRPLQFPVPARGLMREAALEASVDSPSAPTHFTFEPETQEIEQGRDGAVIYWSGVTTLPSGERAHVQLTEIGESVVGRIQASGALFDIRRVSPTEYAIVEVARDSYVPDHPFDEFDQTEMNANAVAHAGARTCPAATRQRQLDLMFVFTATAAQGHDAASLQEIITNPVTEFKFALARSGVDTIDVPMPQDPPMVSSYDDDAFISGCGKGCSRPWVRHRDRLVTRNDGFLDEVFAERFRRRADIVVLIVADTKVCGVVPLEAMGPGARRDTAFAVVSLSCLSRATLAHEIGHLLGSRHEGIPDGDRDYNFAISRPSAQQGWASVGATSCYSATTKQDTCTRNLERLAFYARTTDPENGDEHRDEARAIREFAPCVAGFGALLTQ